MPLFARHLAGTNPLRRALLFPQQALPLLTAPYTTRATTLDTMSTPHPHNSLSRFHALLATNPRILAVCGAGLSAPSGLPTFRGAGGLWRTHRAMDLATPEAFEADPGLVWLFYGYRRHVAMGVEPGDGHRALAGMAEKYGDFLCVSQNVDNLLERAGHRREKLHKIHGCLFGLKCSNKRCTWRDKDYTSDPLFSALEPASAPTDSSNPLPLLDPSTPAPNISRSEIPKCPSCSSGLQRPDIVWFGEGMADETVEGIESWMDRGVDVVLSIGTSEAVSTAERFLWMARDMGAVYVNVNMDAETPGKLKRLEEGDFAFGGDSAVTLPKLFAPILEG